MPLQLLEVPAAERRHGHDRHAETIGEYVDGDVGRVRLVAHIQAERERDPMLGELQGEKQRAPQVADVADLHDVGLTRGNQQIAGDALFERLRSERVRPRRIDDLAQLAVDLRERAGDLDGRAGVVRHRRVALREAGEDERLADVRLSDQQQLARGQELDDGGWLRHVLNASCCRASHDPVMNVTRPRDANPRHMFVRSASCTA